MSQTQNTTKKAPCHFFQAGTCTKGTSCPYSHVISGGGKPRPVTPPKNAASVPCIFFQKGTCTQGTLCQYSHDAAPTSPKPPITTPCINGEQCTNPKCAYVHPPSWDPSATGSTKNAISWEVWQPSTRLWSPLPPWVGDAMTKHYDAGTLAFELIVKQEIVRCELDTATQDWSGASKKHLHFRGIHNATVVVGGQTTCQRCLNTAVEPEIRDARAGKPAEWSSFDRRKFCWVPYDSATNEQIEKAYKMGQPQIEITVGGGTFKVIIGKLIQVNSQGLHRHVKRTKGNKVAGGEESCAECLTNGGSGISTKIDTTATAPAKVHTSFDLPKALATSKLYNRDWVCLQNNSLSSDLRDVVDPRKNFVFMQWNVLFSEFASGSKNCCPIRYLTAEHRFPLIIQYIEKVRPTVFTLQELDNPTSSYSQRFCHDLEQLGYKGEVYAKVRPNADAVGIFWLKEQFTLQKPPLPVSFADKDTSGVCAADVHVGLAVDLVHIPSGQSLVVATTHLKAAKLQEAGRIAQMKTFLEAISVWMSGTQDIILAGDFNSSPCWELGGWLLRDQKITPQLNSVYDCDVVFLDRRITIYMPHTQDVLDYVMHTPGLRATHVLKIPGERDIVQQSMNDVKEGVAYRQLPIPSFPSDHLPLAVVIDVFGE